MRADAATDELLRLIDILNPANEPGRITLVARMGDEKIKKYLPPLLRTVKSAGKHVVWCSDPMHGNTQKAEGGYKTREFERIMAEVRAFLAICDTEDEWPGGIHLEMTGHDVTECTGGVSAVTEADLGESYQTHCDPRLNATQALEIAFLMADALKKGRMKRRGDA